MTANLQIPPEFDTAPKAERIAFVEALWDRIARDLDTVPIPAEHERILAERLSEYELNPEAGQPWSEVRDRLLAELRNV